MGQEMLLGDVTELMRARCTGTGNISAVCNPLANSSICTLIHREMIGSSLKAQRDRNDPTLI